MAKRNCKHKDKRLEQTQKKIRRNMEDAVVGSLSVASFENLDVSEKSSAGWLNDYLEEPKNMNHWHRKDYKPEKYNSPQRSDRSPKYPETQTKYHRCAKHGLVPLNVEDIFAQIRVTEVEHNELIASEPTDSRTSLYTYGRKYDDVGINFLEYVPKVVEATKKLIELCNKYPRVSTTILTILFLWWLSSQMESWMSHGAASLVRIGRPAAHWSSVSLEQFANRLRSFATSTDDLVEGFYCDFARSWCHRFDIMCDVRCSFMDKAIQRLRSA